MEKIRSFIAVELPGEIKRSLARLQEKLKSGSAVPVKWVDPGNVHLTLKFLGDVSPEKIDAVTSALETTAQGMLPFDIQVSGLGVFPNMNRVQVIWVGLGGELEKLGQFQRRIEESLAALGFPPENRPFRPHLTLARVRDYARPDERQKLGQLIASTKFEVANKFNVDAIRLMKSQLTREGPIYSSISTIKLR